MLLTGDVPSIMAKADRANMTRGLAQALPSPSQLKAFSSIFHVGLIV